MNGTDFMMGMNYLEDALIDEAETACLKKRRSHGIPRFCAAAAACIGIVLITILWENRTIFLPDNNNANIIEYTPLAQNTQDPFTDDSSDNTFQNRTDSSHQDAQDIVPIVPNASDNATTSPFGSSAQKQDAFAPNTPDSSTASPSGSSINGQTNPSGQEATGSIQEPATSVPLDMAKIYVNDFSNLLSSDAARLKPDPALYDEVSWGMDDIISYYGKDLTPAYIPAGLVPASWNGNATAIIKKDGTVAEDTVWLNFYLDYNENSFPAYTGSETKGIDLTASKLGILECAVYMFTEDMKPSEIAGVSVMIGHRSMSYGPYDPETHEPSGYYDLYEADFVHDDIEYQIIAKRIALEEFIKVIESIITGNAEP